MREYLDRVTSGYLLIFHVDGKMWSIADDIPPQLLLRPVLFLLHGCLLCFVVAVVSFAHSTLCPWWALGNCVSCWRSFCETVMSAGVTRSTLRSGTNGLASAELKMGRWAELILWVFLTKLYTCLHHIWLKGALCHSLTVLKHKIP